MPFAIAAGAAKAGVFLKRVTTSPWFWAALLVAGLAGGTFLYLRHDKKEAVAAAVAGSDQKATNTALQTQATVAERQQAVEQKFIILREQTIKDYGNARATLNAAPADERTAPASRVIVDTLNHLDSLRANRDANAVPVADVPVG